MAAGLVLAACKAERAIWLAGQAEPGRPVFGIGDEERGSPVLVATLIVSPCDGYDGTGRNARWFLVREDQESGPLARVTYGRIPAGFAATRYRTEEKSTTAVAPPLTAGCYVADIDGGRTLRFEIGADGTARALTR